MKRINFNQRPTPVARGSSRATCENSTKRMWWLVVTVSVPSGFSDLIVARSLLWCLCLLQSLCHALSSGVNHNASARRQHFSSPSLAGSQTWCPVPPWSMDCHSRGSSLTLFKGFSPRMGPPESYSGVWGILVHPSPPVQAYLWTTSFLGRIFPGLHTG